MFANTMCTIQLVTSSGTVIHVTTENGGFEGDTDGSSRFSPKLKTLSHLNTEHWLLDGLICHLRPTCFNMSVAL